MERFPGWALGVSGTKALSFMGFPKRQTLQPVVSRQGPHFIECRKGCFMSPVRMYSKSWCGFCSQARSLLERKGVDFELLDVTYDRALEQEMQQKTGRRTVPQIFIGEQHVGGCDDLYALERAGKLDALLQAAGAQS